MTCVYDVRIAPVIASCDKIAYIVFTKLTTIDNYKLLYVLIDNYGCSTYEKEGKCNTDDLTKYNKYAVSADLYIMADS